MGKGRRASYIPPQQSNTSFPPYQLQQPPPPIFVPPFPQHMPPGGPTSGNGTRHEYAHHPPLHAPVHNQFQAYPPAKLPPISRPRPIAIPSPSLKPGMPGFVVQPHPHLVRPCILPTRRKTHLTNVAFLSPPHHVHPTSYRGATFCRSSRRVYAHQGQAGRSCRRAASPQTRCLLSMDEKDRSVAPFSRPKLSLMIRNNPLSNVLRA